MNINVGIMGATGYTGIELVRLLQQHPQVKLAYLASESHCDKTLNTVYPHLHDQNQNLKNYDLDEISSTCDVVFLALPSGKAVGMTQALLFAGKKVIDLGADFRLRNANEYKKWYGEEAADSDLQNQAVYGLAEAGYREQIQTAALIANPGCYPTATILSVLPALSAEIIEINECIFDVKSGISGSGRTAQLNNHFCEVMENLIPYQLAGKHRHTPEIEQELAKVAKQSLTIQFTPHLIPMTRGILSTGYFKLKKNITQHEVNLLYQQFYKQEPFIRLVESYMIPNVKQVCGTNYCDIGVYVDVRTKRLIAISVIDNLIKGAAGQAIQNMNLMYRFQETMGLTAAAIYP